MMQPPNVWPTILIATMTAIEIYNHSSNFAKKSIFQQFYNLFLVFS